MGDFSVFGSLALAFGDRLRVTSQYFQFHVAVGATFYIRRGRTAGFSDEARIRETAAERFPGGKELDSYLFSECRREWRPSGRAGGWYEYVVDSEHIGDVLAIIQDGLPEDFIESDDWAA